MKRRDILYAIPLFGLTALAGCNDAPDKARVEAINAKVTLGLMPDVFVEQYNESVPIVLDALLENDAFSRRSIAKMYLLYEHSVHKGNTQGVFKSASGPKRTPVFGTTSPHGELATIGVSLGDNGTEARQDFILIATIIGRTLTNAPPKRIRKTMMRLLVTQLDNPEQVVAEGIGDVLFTALLSRTGITIQAEHKQ